MGRHVNIKVSGRVQGVYFRATARDVANALGLKGFVRNERDDSVYIEAEGDSVRIDQFLDWCRQGPPQAVVDNVEVTDGAVKGYKEFEIRRF